VALQQLKTDPTVIITKDDEGNITTVLDKECCDHKIKKMLDDQGTYKHLKANPTVSTNKDVDKCVNNFLEIKNNTKEASFKLKHLDATTPRLYRLPKLPKENIPLRRDTDVTRLARRGDGGCTICSTIVAATCSHVPRLFAAAMHDARRYHGWCSLERKKILENNLLILRFRGRIGAFAGCC